MSNLKFDESLCAACETYDCLTRCQYMKLTPEQAKEEKSKINRGEDSRVLHDCVTCYACEEYCPKGNHPFYKIVEAQEARGMQIVPRPIEKQQVRMMAHDGKSAPKELQGPLLDMCAFGMFKDMSIIGSLFENVSIISGNDIFCNLMYLHFARNSVIKQRLSKSLDNLQKFYLEPNGINEVICFHDECYGTFTSWAPAFGVDIPFKPVYFFDFLLKRLAERKHSLNPLPMKVAYQRPCSNRLVPETQHYVDDILKILGAERVERTYDGENALCCGAGIMGLGRYEYAEEIQQKNIDDMLAAGATACVFNCPFCMVALGEKAAANGLMPLLLSDLCRLALGEKLKGWG
ncbi:MAG: (Fe-S)-binding protein [Candidatus Abyssobacteria bacterium SURF_5]|uniref:(Fe-S)-binding protein n=1 Tax=Abyssobacteria bacterium (strain SURF_5) TaxID=2093360 RepID=A0A3A4N2K5_ABYX5|nr:MAG: (Fe-S)-binding protein [Candidatus Abyssubacteria bacterium SURF_5]